MVPAWIFPAACYCFNILICGQSSSFCDYPFSFTGVVSSCRRFSLPPLIRFSSPALFVRDTSAQGIFFSQFVFGRSAEFFNSDFPDPTWFGFFFLLAILVARHAWHQVFR
jgi:hypothetical protein